MSFLCSRVVGLPGGLALAQDAQGRLTERVTDVAGEPIVDAEIAVVPGGPGTTSNADGRFSLTVKAGERVIRIRRIGYQAQQFRSDLRPDETKEVPIVREHGAYELPEVAVNARRLKPIEEVALRTPSLLAAIPGVTLRFRHLGPSRTDVDVRGSSGSAYGSTARSSASPIFAPKA